MFQQTIKNFQISFNNGTNVSCGDLVTGNISFSLTKETKITSITMALTGKANVHWSTGGGGGRKRRRTRRHFSAKLEYFNLNSVILQENSATGGTGKLQPGTHVYSFSCLIPQGDFPSSFRGAYGQVVYSITVSIHRPWHMSKDFVTELNFVNHMDTSHPELGASLSGSNKMTLCCLCCASGPITMTVSTEKKAFTPGENVKIYCDFSNASSQTQTPKAKLQQKQIFYTHGKKNQNVVKRNLALITGEAISSHTSDVHTEIMLTIPSSAPHTISNCSILDVSYIIEVSLSGRATPDLTVLFPIILCPTPVNTHPPLYL